VAATVAVAFVGLAGCASAAPYNPDRLSADQAQQVGQICQNVMGLSPREPMMWGDALIGDPHLEPGANHYQACVTVLSDQLQSVSAVSLAGQADADCRARGYAVGTPGLAECVLQSEQTRATSARVDAVAMDTTPRSHVGSMMLASPGETDRREQRACAALGLEPPYGAFANCVKDMTDSFYAIDNPVE
jgi:hypothetical protein